MTKRKGKSVKREATTIGKGDVAKVSATAPQQGAEATTSANTATAKAAEAPKPLKIKVTKSDMTYRGARAAWYARLKEYDGKTEGEFLQSAKEKPPALTRNQTAENPTGWISFFRREGVLSLQAGG